MNTPNSPHPLLPNGGPVPIHPSSALSSLTADERNTLYEWLETMPTPKVLRKVAAPRPRGFAIRTHLTTLRRFHARARSHFERQLLQDAATIVEAAEPNTDTNPNLTERLANRVAFALLLLHPEQLNTFKTVSRYIISRKRARLDQQALEFRIRALELKERKLDLKIALATGTPIPAHLQTHPPATESDATPAAHTPATHNATDTGPGRNTADASTNTPQTHEVLDTKILPDLPSTSEFPIDREAESATASDTPQTHDVPAPSANSTTIAPKIHRHHLAPRLPIPPLHTFKPRATKQYLPPPRRDLGKIPSLPHGAHDSRQR